MAGPGITVVTGASGGLGKAVSIELAKRGAPVLMVFRDLARAEVVTREVTDQSGNTSVKLAVADFASLDDVRRLAHDISFEQGAVSTLIHTAGIYAAKRRLTMDGLESMFAINHLAPYVLTRLLLPTLERSAPAKVVLVTAPSSTRPDLADLQGVKRFRPLSAFGASKMGNLLFAFALARRVDPAKVNVHAFHPGLMKSDLTREMPGLLRGFLRLVSRSPEKAGAWLADLVTGKIATPHGSFVAMTKVAKPPAVSQDRDLQEEMWRASASLAGLPLD
jgi:NAD(P)-dependent dehydrogenase (short-subunit alcohol dehydrogenase family)